MLVGTNFEVCFIIQLFRALSDVRDSVPSGNDVDLWLVVEAYEYLRDDPCLPVDVAGSGNDQILNRASKARVDWAIASASKSS